MAPTAHEPSLARAADELAELLSEGALQDNLIMQRLPGLRTVLESAGLRLLSFCQCFPECFSLRFLPEWGLRVSLAPASSEPALDLPLVENMLEAVIVQHVERYHDKHSANCKAPAAPMGWLVRRTGPELDAYIAHAARRHLHFQLDPEASGFANLRLALRGCVASHVRDFVHARSEVFSWVEGPPCDGGTHASCHCQGAVALTPERAATVMAARRARLQAEAAKREARREAREARRAKEDAAMEEQPDGWREDVELTAAELLAACTEGGAGGTLLLMRGPARSASLFAEELRAAARHVALPPALLRPLCRGLWLLPPPAAGDAAGGEAHAALRALLPSLGGVRLAVTLLAAARGDDADALVAAAAALPRRRAHWSLELEQHFPAADGHTLPFAPLGGVAPLALRLAHAWGGGFVTARGREDADDYVLLLTRPLLILCAEDAAWPRREHSASEEALASGGGLGGLGGLGGPGGGDRAWLEPWVRAWEGRPFSFSAALDPLVALAVVHLAAFEHHCRTAAAAGGSGGGESGGGSGRSAAHSLRVYDPCCGSGTIVAAARALGASVAGSDIRAKFVAGVGANLAHVALSEGVALFEHDATLALPREGEAQGRGLAAQLVVTNPPWGKNIGTLDCGVPIVARLVAQHRGATFCFVVNSHALTALRAVEGLLVRRHVRLGGIEVVVACCAPGEGKRDD